MNAVATTTTTAALAAVSQDELAAYIRNCLAQSTGSEQYHRLTINRKILFTDGCKTVAKLCRAFWLMDVIASHLSHTHSLQSHDWLQWSLKPRPTPEEPNRWIVVASTTIDPGHVVCYQVIHFTDFPLPEGVTINAAKTDDNGWLCYLPSED